MPRCLLSLGANLGDPEHALQQAARLLDELPEVEVEAASDVLISQPAGGPPQPRYYNAALRVETTHGPHQLLRAAQDVERRLGRQRQTRWGPRSIDIDLLLYESHVVFDQHLEIPHPRLAVRRFALAPAAQLAPAWSHPLIDATLGQLLDRLERGPNVAALCGGTPQQRSAVAAAVPRRAAEVWQPSPASPQPPAELAGRFDGRQALLAESWPAQAATPRALFLLEDRRLTYQGRPSSEARRALQAGVPLLIAPPLPLELCVEEISAALEAMGPPGGELARPGAIDYNGRLAT